MIELRGASVCSTRCGVARHVPLVKRSSMSPTITTNSPRRTGASTHSSTPSPCRGMNCSPGLRSARARMTWRRASGPRSEVRVAARGGA
eukprot:5491978-Prymnesium_polylepis.1